MSYDPRYKKVKASGAKIPWIVLGIFNVICIIAIVYIWHIYSGKIWETENGLLKSKKSTDAVINDQPDTVGEIGGKTVYKLVDDMIQFARPEEETKPKTSTFVKEQLDTVSEIGGEKIGGLVDHMVKSARPNEEEKAREEAEAAARRARERKLSELKQRKKQLDSKIAAADSRHRMATRTVPITPVFETTDSDSTRRISAQQKALKEKLRSEADEAGQKLRKLQIERQHIIHEISKLEK
ncbi:MAG: hypothetical protein IKX48_16115 [Victivallales bacterium]|nr:hypothetical protein [Victivallales bacterium]